MNRRKNRRLFSHLAGSVVFCAMNALLCAFSAATATAADLPAGAPDSGPPQYSDNGSSNCQRCHFNPIPKDLHDGTAYLFRLTESHTWAETDRHSKAFELLNCTRGQEMAQRLGWKVTTDVRCLSCHSGWQPDRRQPDEAVLAEGVACEACHGPSSKYINAHSVPQWRSVPLAERADHFGMISLRDPERRADVCLSCHVGNAALGRVVTHEMYAAGHPPLPSFELRNFSDSMRHWDDLPEQVRKVEKVRKGEDQAATDAHRQNHLRKPRRPSNRFNRNSAKIIKLCRD